MKRVKEDQYLLTENKTLVNGEPFNNDEISNIYLQKPNSQLPFLGTRLRLHIFNLARPNIDSILYARIYDNPNKLRRKTKWLSRKQLDRYVASRKGINAWLKRTGEAPVIINEEKTAKTAKSLDKYFFSKGWFDVKTSYHINTNDKQQAQVTYNVDAGLPYLLNSISTRIATPMMDSIYQRRLKNGSLLKAGDQYDESIFETERERLTSNFRNMGYYHFGQDYISFEIDTIGTNKKIDTDLIIKNRAIRNSDTIIREPFKIYTIKEVNIFTDYTYENQNLKVQDSASYEGYKLYAYNKLKYRPKALTNAIFINKDHVFKDIARTRTYRALSDLNTFRYPNIEYIENPSDSTLTANIYLSPLKKYSLGFDFDVTQSNIQTIGLGFSTGLNIRNVFKGAETLNISTLGSIGASKDPANDEDRFFDINEVGADIKLTIPRMFFPINTEKIIPKYMSPSTRISLGATSQRNIGLDKQTFTGAFTYNWYPSKKVTNTVDLFNIQFIKNLNTANYFGVYQNSYDRLNNIARDILYIGEDESLSYPEGTNNFMHDVLSHQTVLTPEDDNFIDVSNIRQRQQRLTEDNLIFASNFSYVKNRRKNLLDNDFSTIRFKIELAGNLLSNLSKLTDSRKNDNDQYEIFGVAFSQYIKGEIDYVKYFSLGDNNVLATRTYVGLALPYGNSSSIPFSKSFFAGGPNDNRAWTAYNLGPGRSNYANEFNEANFKINLSVEHRFNLLGNLYGAFFVDAGNIWNVLDDVEDEAAIFKGISSLKDIAVGSGLGFRYDFRFFVLRADIGFKTYDPSLPYHKRWFRDYNFSNAVYNIGINYPF